METNNRPADALDQYEAAAKIDDRFAELQFRIARCLAKAGRLAEAQQHFDLARDLDVLRFRADSRINAITREVAGEQQAAGVRFVDTERALSESAGWTSDSVRFAGTGGGPLYGVPQGKPLL